MQLYVPLTEQKNFSTVLLNLWVLGVLSQYAGMTPGCSKSIQLIESVLNFVQLKAITYDTLPGKREFCCNLTDYYLH